MRKIDVAPWETFGSLTVMSEVDSPSKRRFLCRCSCSRQVEVRLDHLRSGHTSSCGNCGLDYNGVRKSIRHWASLCGIKESTLRARLKLMSLKEALERGK